MLELARSDSEVANLKVRRFSEINCSNVIVAHG
jgi:hypothetical protein